MRQPSVAAPGCMFTQELQVSPLMLPDAVPDSETVQGRTMLDELKGVVQEGFACVKLRKRSKAPVDPDWTSAPIPSYSQVRKWWESGFNIGVRLGKPSKLSDGLYLHVIDVDIRDPDDPEGAFEEAAAKLRELFIGVNWKRFPTVQSGSGGKSRHVYFSTQKPFRSQKIARSEETVFIDGKKSRRWEIELFGTGKQVAMPPSKHPSGGTYRWLNEPDWEFGIPLIDADLIEEVLGADELVSDRDPETKEPVEDIDVDEIREMLDELVDLAETHEDWVRVGMAVHHQLGPEKGWPIFDGWSKKRGNYNKKGNWAQWRNFKRNHPNPRTLRSLIKEFNKRRTIQSHVQALEEFDEMDAEKAEFGPQTAQEFDDAPDYVLSIPGALQDVVDFYNENSLVEQPAFAVLAALGLGSVVLGRNVRTEMNNYSSIYLIGVGDTGAGKETIATVLTHILQECALDSLLGPEDFTSEGAILSRLQVRPKTILITDEFGKRLTEDRSQPNAMKQGTQRAYMSLFNKLHSIWTPTGYSTTGKTKQEAEAILNKRVIRPALTIAAATTPSTFYEGINSKDLSSGFLNRFIIIPATRGLQKQRIFAPPMKVSKRLKDWVAWASTLCAHDDDSFALKNDPFTLVDPKTIPFTEKAKALLNDIEGERVKRQMELVPLGLETVFQRSREIAHRVALIVALSEEYEWIQARHVEWAWNFVSYYHNKMAEAFMTNLDKSPLHQLADNIARRVIEKGELGLTRREIIKGFRKWKKLSLRESNEVEGLLKRDYGIVETEIKRPSGPKRVAFVSPKYHPKLQSR